MNTSVKLNKDFLRLLDLVRDSGRYDLGSVISVIYCKQNILYATNGKIALRCDLLKMRIHQREYELEDGFYEVAGNYLVKNNNVEGKFPLEGINKAFSNTFTKMFKIRYSGEEINTFFDFITTLTSQEVMINFLEFEKQLKQLFYKGNDFVIYFIDKKKAILVECDYVVKNLISDEYVPISFIIMPKICGQIKIEDVKYNPIEEFRIREKIG